MRLSYSRKIHTQHTKHVHLLLVLLVIVGCCLVDAEDFSCFEIPSSDLVNVCSGHGICVDTDICSCFPGHTNSQCETHTCFGIIYNDEPNVCSGHGTCIGPNMCNCTIQDGVVYGGDSCELIIGYVHSNSCGNDCKSTDYIQSGVDTLFVKELQTFQSTLKAEYPNYSFRLKMSSEYLWKNSDGSFNLNELGGNLTISVVNLVLVDGLISFRNGSGLIGRTKDNISPLYMFSNDFYVSFKVNVKEFKEYNPIMNITSGPSFSIYMSGTSLFFEGQTIEFNDRYIQTIPNEIHMLSQTYTVVIIKSFVDGTKIYVNDRLCFESES
ncbi:predicted protein, partial [Naegleria gruberi]